jgi:hypothetical protein
MNLKRYFEERDKDKPVPKWNYGDRISGKVGKITVIGMVIREDYSDPQQVLCHLDLPIKINDTYRYVLNVPAKGMKRLKVIE